MFRSKRRYLSDKYSTTEEQRPLVENHTFALRYMESPSGICAVICVLYSYCTWYSSQDGYGVIKRCCHFNHYFIFYDLTCV
jgi:hypothetical protein